MNIAGTNKTMWNHSSTINFHFDKKNCRETEEFTLCWHHIHSIRTPSMKHVRDCFVSRSFNLVLNYLSFWNYLIWDAARAHFWSQYSQKLYMYTVKNIPMKQNNLPSKVVNWMITTYLNNILNAGSRKETSPCCQKRPETLTRWDVGTSRKYPTFLLISSQTFL